MLALLFVAGLAADPITADDPVEVRLLELQDPGPDSDRRGEAIEGLRQLGRQAVDAADGLLAFIMDEGAPLELRNRAVLALRDIGLPDVDRARLLFGVLANPATDMDLRRTILLAHGDRGEFAAVLVPALLEVLGDPAHGLGLRRQVVFNLSAHGTADGVMEQLTRVVGDASEPFELRSAALDRLRVTAEPSADTIAVLSALATDRSERLDLRLAAIDAVGGMGEGGAAIGEKVSGLILDPSASDPPELQMRAVQALSRLGATDVVATRLVEVLFRAEAPAEVQRAVATLLAARDRLVPVEVESWMTLLGSSQSPVEVRRLAAGSLARSSHLGAESLALCERLLADEEEDLSIRLAAAEHLRAHGLAVEPALETVEGILGDEGQPAELREVAGGLWVQVARNWLGAPEDSTWESIQARLAAIDQAKALLEALAVTSVRARQSLAELNQIRAVLSAQQKAWRWDRARDWMQRHPRITWAGGGVGLVALLALGLSAAWFVMARRAPMRVWEWDRRLSRRDWQGPDWLGGRRMGLRHVLLLARQAETAPVLDAWLRAARPYVRQQHEQLRVEHGATPYVSLPVRWNGQRYVEPPWDSIRQRLTVSGGGVLVSGEAGTGKTVCALECAWRMLEDGETEGGQAAPLPVWVRWPQSVCDGVMDLAVEVRSALALWVPVELLPDRGTIRQLMRQGRLLPFLDGVSEWPSELRGSVQAGLDRLRRFHGSYLLSMRGLEGWGDQSVTRLELSKLGGAVAVGFLQSYLARSYWEERTPRGRLLTICQHWSALTDEELMPVQVIRCFGDVAARQPDVPPENLAVVARDYVRLLHHDAGPGSFDESHVVQVAGRLAWAELSRSEGETGLTVIERQAVLAGRVDGMELVEHLERRLGLLERWQPGDRIRFRQRPLAVYLATFHLMEENRGNDDAWRRFLQQSFPTSGKVLTEVLHALWDAGLVSSDSATDAPLPDWVSKELAQRLGIDPVHGEARRDAMRARELVRQILTPENPERSSALEQLAGLGAAAASTLPTLESVIVDQAQDLDVRFGALTALGLLGVVALPARGTLEVAVRDRREQLFIRLKALEYLAALDRDRAATVAILVERLADPGEAELFRLRAGHILSALPGDGEVIRSALERLDVSGFPVAVCDLVERIRSERATSPRTKAQG
jgi:hypothetical protein